MKGAILMVEVLYMLEKTLLAKEKYGLFIAGSDVLKNFLFSGEYKSV